MSCWQDALQAQAELTQQKQIQEKLAQEKIGLTSAGDPGHPQLSRFLDTHNPQVAIATYLHLIIDEADARGHSLDGKLVPLPPDPSLRIPVTTGQLRHELDLLLDDLARRDPERGKQLNALHDSSTIPMEAAVFVAIEGSVEPWESSS